MQLVSKEKNLGTFGKPFCTIKMKYHYLIIVMFLWGCAQSNSEEQHTISNQTSQEIDEDEGDEDQIYQENIDHQKHLMKSKNFTYTCIDNCDSGYASEENVMSHDGKVYFKLDKAISDSLIHIQYRFIENCCMEFGGDYEMNDDTIKLTYFQLNMEICECFCEYEYAFSIPNKGYNNYTITLNEKVLD